MVFANFPGVIDEQRLEQSLQLRDYLSSSVLKGQLGKISIVFPRALSFTSQRIEVVQVLPFIPDADKQPTNIGMSDIVFESELGHIVEYLVYLWLGQKIFEIFGMSRLAEQAARFMHLENCNERIKDLDKKLRFQYFRTRHEIIDQNMRELFAARLLHE
jgi:F0F1-type ATP synthase, gamma subunit